MSDKKRIMMIRPGQRFPRMGFAQPLGLLSLISMLRKHYPDQFEIDLVEMARQGENSLCCGGGGGQMWLETDAETRINLQRLNDAADAQADIIATA